MSEEKTGSLELDGVTKRFGEHTVLHDISLEIDPGELVVIVGPSGCGKSTLLRIVAGLETMSSGAIRIGGRDVSTVPAAKRGLAMVFQSYALYPHKTVAQNMGFALKIAGEKRAEIDRRVAEAARILQLEPLLDRKPAALSGGQRQRVAIGRCIVRHPQVFLFDEPLSNLDAALRADMRVELGDLHQRLGATMLYVTHDQVEAMTLADKIVVLKGGRIQQVGRPKDLYERPRNLFVAGFIGSPSMNLIDGEAAPAGFRAPGLTLPLRQTLVAGRCKLGVRPEHVTLTSPEAGRPEMQVDLVEYLGDESVVHGHLMDDTPFTLKTSGEAPCRVGARVGLQLDASAVHLFDAEGTRADFRAATPA
jgi:ABC-type sugar transport system ATPase subunit